MSQSANICTKLIGNIPLLEGSVSTAPSIQFSSSVCSLVTMITSPSLKDSSSSLSASQSYSARQRRRPTVQVLPPAGELTVPATGYVVASISGCGCCRGQKKYGCSGVSRWKNTEKTHTHTHAQQNTKDDNNTKEENLSPILGFKVQFLKLFNCFVLQSVSEVTVPLLDIWISTCMPCAIYSVGVYVHVCTGSRKRYGDVSDAPHNFISQICHKVHWKNIMKHLKS